ncbi:MBL fold metallo-hydrolase [Desulfallas sp. Bu1-1]|nr:MBL fold metallo-hydrolase [Desulfallas sp. Bu1-1]
MRLTILGCWAPYPRPGGACSGYLMRCGKTSLMLDAGNGSFAELTRHIDFSFLSGLVITHFHPDHYVDVFCLRHAVEGARREGKMNEPVKLFIPPAPEEIYRKLAGYTGAFDVVNIDELPVTGEIPGLQARKVRLGDTTLYFAPTTHSLPGYSVVARHGNKTVCYSGDTAAGEEIKKAANGADLFICEASGMNKDAAFLAGVHMTAGQAGSLAREAGAGRLVITHFWPEYDINILLAESGEGFEGAVEPAVQGKTFTV